MAGGPNGAGHVPPRGGRGHGATAPAKVHRASDLATRPEGATGRAKVHCGQDVATRPERLHLLGVVVSGPVNPARKALEVIRACFHAPVEIGLDLAAVFHRGYRSDVLGFTGRDYLAASAFVLVGLPFADGHLASASWAFHRITVFPTSTTAFGEATGWGEVPGTPLGEPAEEVLVPVYGL